MDDAPTSGLLKPFAVVVTASGNAASFAKGLSIGIIPQANYHPCHNRRNDMRPLEFDFAARFFQLVIQKAFMVVLRIATEKDTD